MSYYLTYTDFTNKSNIEKNNVNEFIQIYNFCKDIIQMKEQEKHPFYCESYIKEKEYDMEKMIQYCIQFFNSNEYKIGSLFYHFHYINKKLL